MTTLVEAAAVAVQGGPVRIHYGDRIADHIK